MSQIIVSQHILSDYAVSRTGRWSVDGSPPELWSARPRQGLNREHVCVLAGLSSACYAVCTSLIMHVWWHIGRGGTEYRGANKKCMRFTTESSANNITITTIHTPYVGPAVALSCSPVFAETQQQPWYYAARGAPSKQHHQRRHQLLVG
ncbi:hypothetical protein J3459_013545 [Metarhizium acridum]|uniref:uncharacterized protein n=1 Tax=Metarhizium acridum TaxID=92637 RepID=UPI001C6CDC48|nr:hypothetical protein J3459_013545 [Metarhizium acridum]KAG8421768.1 hypothetical protein J3458_003614 [Metarhizium acridum]